MDENTIEEGYKVFFRECNFERFQLSKEQRDVLRATYYSGASFVLHQLINTTDEDLLIGQIATLFKELNKLSKTVQ